MYDYLYKNPFGMIWCIFKRNLIGRYYDEIVNNMTTIKNTDSVKEKIDKRKFKEEYLKIKPRLERTTVMSLIVELREEKEKKK